MRVKLGLALFGALVMMLYGTAARSQAGSSGGVVGKQGKSVSGEEIQPSPRRVVPDRVRRKSTAGSGIANRVFNSPRINGKLVDRCLTYGSNCGEPSASVFCRSKGFARAIEWKWANAATTFIQGTASNCVSGVFPCGGFTRVSCE